MKIESIDDVSLLKETPLSKVEAVTEDWRQAGQNVCQSQTTVFAA